MKNLFFTILISFFFVPSIQAQQSQPILNIISITPQNPTEHDSIKIHYSAWTGNQSYFINRSVKIDSNLVNMDICLEESYLTFPSNHIDTVELGKLPAGNYTINLSGYITNDSNCLAVIDSNSIADSFTVSSIVGINELSIASKVSIYPNPVKNNLTIEMKDDIHLNDFTIQNIEGKTVQINRSTTLNSHSFNLNMESLSAGMYILILQTNEGELRHKFVVQ